MNHSSRIKSDNDFIQLYDIKPLDCIFFKGTELISEAIMIMERLTLGVGEWSHVGIVVNRDIIPGLNVKDDDLYIWESTISSSSKLITGDPTLDAESGKGVFGVQVRKLKDVIKNSIKLGVKIGWGRLRNNPIFKKYDIRSQPSTTIKERDIEEKTLVTENFITPHISSYQLDDQSPIAINHHKTNNILTGETDEEFKTRKQVIRDILCRIHKDNYHKPYTVNFLRLFSAMFNCSSCCRRRWCIGEDWRFCSQLVLIVYGELGITSKKFDPEIVVPQDLATPEHSEEQLPKLLDDVVIIDRY